MRLEGKKRTMAAMMASLGLAGCGGGGEGGPPPVTGDLTPASYVTTTSESLDSVLLSLDTRVLLSLAQPASAGSAAAGSVLDFPRLQQELLGRMSRRNAERERAAFVTTNQLPCSGGGHLQITQTFASWDVYVRGDKVSVVPVDCYEDGQQVTGKLEAELVEVVDSSTRFLLKMDIRAHAFGTPAYRVEGRATTRTELHGNYPVLTKQMLGIGFSDFSITSTSPATSVTLNHSYELVHDYTTSRYTLALDGVIQTGGQSYRLEQQTPFLLSQLNGNPLSGVVHLKDKDGDRVIVTATATHFTYAFQPAGSSAPTVGPVDGPLYSSLGGGL